MSGFAGVSAAPDGKASFPLGNSNRDPSPPGRAGEGGRAGVSSGRFRRALRVSGPGRRREAKAAEGLGSGSGGKRFPPRSRRSPSDSEPRSGGPAKKTPYPGPPPSGGRGQKRGRKVFEPVLARRARGTRTPHGESSGEKDSFPNDRKGPFAAVVAFSCRLGRRRDRPEIHRETREQFARASGRSLLNFSHRPRGGRVAGAIVPAGGEGWGPFPVHGGFSAGAAGSIHGPRRVPASHTLLFRFSSKGKRSSPSTGFRHEKASPGGDRGLSGGEGAGTDRGSSLSRS